MEEIVVWSDDQKITRGDLNDVGVKARQSLDHVVLDGVGAGYAGFNIVAQGQNTVVIGPGRLYSTEGEVFVLDDDAGFEIDFLADIPVQSQRYAAIFAWGTDAELTHTESREFVIDPVSRQVQAQPTSTRSTRIAKVSRAMGAENPTPAYPTVSELYTVVGWVLLSPGGIVSVSMNPDTRLRSARSAHQMATLVNNRVAAVEPQLVTLGSDIAGANQRIDTRADRSQVFRMAADLARLKQSARLPDSYIDYGADNFLDLTESDVNSAGYAAKVEEGLRFPDAATSTAVMTVANPTDSNIRIINGILMPAFEEIRWRAIVGSAGVIALNSFSYNTNPVTLQEMGRIRYRLGDPFIVSEASNFFKGGVFTDTVKGVFQKNGESFQAMPNGERDEQGHALYRVQKRWEDTISRDYWTRTSTPQGTNLPGFPWVQTFSCTQDMIVTAISIAFSRLDTAGSVTFGICELNADRSPDFNKMLNTVTVPFEQLSTQISVAKAYAFTPTKLKAGVSYGIVIITAANHWVYAADQQQQNAGTLFYMTGGGYFQADPTKNILVDLMIAKFTKARTEVQLGAVFLAGGMTALDILADAIIPAQGGLDFQVLTEGQYRPFDPALPSPLASVPATVPLKMVLVGTSTVQPMIKMATSRVVASRPATALRHQSTARTILSPSDEIIETVRIENFNPAKHTVSLKLRVVNADVNPTATTDVNLGGGVIERKSVFMLGAPISTYKRVVIGGTTDAAELFVIPELTDVAAA